jgi:hypothetical protein
MQSVFSSKFPFEKYWGRHMGAKWDARVRAITAEVQTERFARFIMALTDFMYGTFVAPPGYDDSECMNSSSNRDEQFLSVYADIMHLLDKNHMRHQHALDLPFYVLAMRVGVEAVMRCAFPLWSQSPDGQSTLRRMDRLITILLDPMNYLSHLPPIEACPQALKALHNKRVPIHMPLTFTSPLVRFIIGDPQSNEAKLLLFHKNADISTQQLNIAELQQVLSPTLRVKILQLLTARKLGHMQ